MKPGDSVLVRGVIRSTHGGPLSRDPWVVVTFGDGPAAQHHAAPARDVLTRWDMIKLGLSAMRAKERL